MANDKRIKVSYSGVSCKENGKYDMIVRIDSDAYQALCYHLQYSATHQENFCQTEDAVTLWQSLKDCWLEARIERDELENEY